MARTLEKQLKALRRAGKKGEWAARQCENLLELIRHEGLRHEAVYCKRTKNGEYRIGNCVKYDLGNGYRMVTIRDGRHLFIPFIGGHDETDQWLDRHRYDTFAPDDRVYLHESIGSDDEQQCRDTICEAYENEIRADPYEEELMERVDESLLKTVFQGLFLKQ